MPVGAALGLVLSITLCAAPGASRFASADAGRDGPAPGAAFVPGVSQPLAAPFGTSVEKVYRLLYERLDRCFSPPYGLKLMFDRAQGRAALSLVSGLGLRSLAWLDGEAGRFEIRGVATNRGRETLVTVILANPRLRVLHELLPRWLEGGTGCRP